MQKIFYIGGRSGGHITPLLSLIKNRKNNAEEESIIITTNSTLDYQIINDASYIKPDSHVTINLENIPKKINEFFPYFINLIKSFIKIFTLFYKKKPDIIYTTGGYISVIGCIIAIFFRTKIILYCLDVIPGKASRLISKFANEVHLIFEETPKYLKIKKEKYFFTKMPIRFTENDIKDNKEIKNKLNINTECLIIFIIGGSQGSIEINKIFFHSITEILNNKNISIEKLFCIHQTGVSNLNEVTAWYKNNKINSIVFGYNFNLSDYYNASDIVITRAGAITLSELAFFKKKTLIIPLKGIANDHQTKNALQFIRDCPLMEAIINNENIKEKTIEFIKKNI
jgi:UDP-N-acetylglucosamine--N-acetylmuramyl-(pentapeptide) pyrophosphoryl-undecaprenol N-acetylglucosamine transferase